MAKFKVYQSYSIQGVQFQPNVIYDSANISAPIFNELIADNLISYTVDTVDVNSLSASLADIATVNSHTVTYVYNTDGSVQSTTEKDSGNNVIKTVTYTYNTAGDVATSVTVMNGKTVTTTYNYDANANITSTSNVIS